MNMEEKKVRSLSEGLILVVLLAITLIFFAESVKLFLADRSIASAGGFPLIVAVIMLLADTFMFLEYFRKDMPKKRRSFKNLSREAFPVPVLYMLIAMVTYVTVLPRLGMTISTFVFLAYSFYFLSTIKLRNIGLISAGCVAVIVILFKFVFRVNLP